MKLVLKYKDTIKLYSEELKFQQLLNFVQKEISLQLDTITLSYVDDEGDQIVLGSDDDLSVMENLTGNKSYVKVNVDGKLQEIKQVSAVEVKEDKVENQVEKTEQNSPEQVKPEAKIQEVKPETAAQMTKKAEQQEARRLLKEKRAEEEAIKAKQRAEKKAAAQEEQRLKKLAVQEERQKQKQAKLLEKEQKQAVLKQQKAKKTIEAKEAKEAKEAQEVKEVKQNKQIQETKEAKETKVPSAPKKKAEEAPKKKDNFNVFNKLMTQTISTLVDEKVRNLLPYIKKEINKDVENLGELEDKLVHENFACKVCTINPIIGIRYECPKCEGFSICERCEALYDHEHNLMKIKKLEKAAPAKKVQPSIKKLYETFFADSIKAVSPQKQGASPKKETKESREATERFEKYANPLKNIFGGKLADYRKLTSENKLNLNGLVAMHCEINNISQQEGHNKYVDFLCTKLQKKFKKEPAEMRPLAEDNIDLDYPEMEKAIAKTLKAQDKAKKEETVETEKKLEKIQQIEAVEPKKEQVKEIVEPKVEQCPGAHLKGDKKEVYDMMVEVFGKEKAVDYPKFIQLHINDGKQKIIERWMENVSLYQPSK